MADTCDNLLPLFLEEFEERVTTIEDLLLSDDSTSEVSMRAVKRELHTLKGNSAAVGFPSCSGLCHHLENYLDQSADPTRLVDQLLDGIQILRGAVCGMAEGRDIGDDVRRLLDNSNPHSAPSTGQGQPKRQHPEEAYEKDDAQFESAKAKFVVCLAESEGATESIRNALASYGVRRNSLDHLIRAGSEALSAAVGGARLLVLNLAADSTSLSDAFRVIEELRHDEGLRGQYGERRLNVLAIVDGAAENVRRELRSAGVQYAFSSPADERIPAMVDRSFRAALQGEKQRRRLRFRDLKETVATFGDGTRLRAVVRDESFTGIAVRVLDPSPCEAFGPVAIDVLGAAMPAYVVRLSGRDERGYVTVGCRWGYSPYAHATVRDPAR